MSSMITLDEFRRAAGLTEGTAKRWYQPFMDGYKQYFVYDPLVVAHAIAQLGHESNSFSTLEEGFYYRSGERLKKVFGNRNGLTLAKANKLAGHPQETANFVYGGEWGRKNLGNTQPNDGWFFRGSGLIQLTGRRNFTQAATGTGIKLDRLPELLRHDEGIAASVAFWWLFDHRLEDYFKADDIRGATKVINGGLNGIVDREDRLARAKKVLGVRV